VKNFRAPKIFEAEGINIRSAVEKKVNIWKEKPKEQEKEGNRVSDSVRKRQKY
jgi:hypothetical protein